MIKMKLPNFLKKYFWEVDFDKLNFEKRPEYIILRLLEYGGVKAIRWLLKNFPEKKIKDTIIKQRGLSSRSLYFWSLFFNIDKEEIPCLKKSYQKRRKSYWSH